MKQSSLFRGWGEMWSTEDLLLFNEIRPEHVGARLLAEHLRAGGKEY